MSQQDGGVPISQTDEAGVSTPRGGHDPRTDDRRTRLRETLIDKALEILSTEGLGAMQARRVAQLAGCSVGAIYNVFPDLDELILRANALTLKRVKAHEREALAALPTTATRAERAMALAMAYVDFAFRYETAWRSLFDYRLTNKKPYPGWYHEAQADALSVLDATIPSALAGADPEAEESRQRLERTTWAAVHGVVATNMDSRLEERSRAEIEAQVRLLMTLLSKGLSAGP
ncbi:MAG: WHG domain-containing protein [Rhizobiales bacterium]|nr:WHG domain-containing protein [Hyphomicrobiales bacterium]